MLIVHVVYANRTFIARLIGHDSDIAVCGDVKSSESAVTKGMTAPAAVSGFKASEIKDTSAVLKWNTSAKVSKYVVEIKVDGKWVVPTASSAEGYLSVLSSGVCNVKNLNPAKEYLFRIYAIGKFDSTRAPRSEYSSELPVITKLPTPSITRSSVTGNNVALEWTSVDGAKEYKVYRNNTIIATVSGTSYTDKKVDPGKPSYCVEAVNSITTSDKSEPKIVEISIAGVTNLRATEVSHSFVTLAWDKVEGAAKYKIFKNGIEVADTAALSYKISNLVGYSDYTFTVQAISADGDMSSEAIECEVKTKLTPVDPSKITVVKRDETSVTLSWSKVNKNTEKYRIYINGKLLSCTNVGDNYTVSLPGKDAVELHIVTYIGSEDSEQVSYTVQAYQQKAA